MAKNWYSSWLYTKIYARFVLRRLANDPKKREELAHWVGEAFQRNDNAHFAEFFCREFGYTTDYFDGMDLIDIGCGPAGSLEWAEGAKSRIGVDPLGREYFWLGAWKQKMKYLACDSASMPIKSESIDVVFTFNALDHVDDLDATMNEITRILRPGGEIICIVDCNHPPTVTEPTFIKNDFVQNYFSDWNVKECHYYAHTSLRIYDSLRAERVIDPSVPDFKESYILKLHAFKK